MKNLYEFIIGLYIIDINIFIQLGKSGKAQFGVLI